LEYLHREVPAAPPQPNTPSLPAPLSPPQNATPFYYPPQYYQYPPYPYPKSTAHRGKTIASLVLGIFALIYGSITGILVLAVQDPEVLYSLILPLPLGIIGLSLSVYAFVNNGWNKGLAKSAVIVNSIADGIMLLTVLIALI